MYNIVTNEDAFSIQPRDIELNRRNPGFCDTFGNRETEVTAHFIVELCQERGGWYPFTEEEIENTCARAGKRFNFGRLVKAELVGPDDYRGGGWIVRGPDGRYRVTEDFILRCHLASMTEKVSTTT